MLSNFLVKNLKCLKIIAHDKLKKHATLISTLETSKIIFSLLPLAAQTEAFMLQNVAFRPTVYKTGAVTT